MLPGTVRLNARVAEQLRILGDWNMRWSVSSVATSLAVFWADELERTVARAATRERISSMEYAIRRATAAERLQALAAASDTLALNFGSWKTPWGEINRFQPLSADTVHAFND